MKHIAILFSLMTYLLQVEFEVALVFEFNFIADFPIGIIFTVWFRRIHLKQLLHIHSQWPRPIITCAVQQLFSCTPFVILLEDMTWHSILKVNPFKSYQAATLNALNLSLDVWSATVILLYYERIWIDI